MLKALYDFQAVYPKTISFDEGEYFILYQTSSRQRNWWQVVSMKGNIGFVPSNYVMKIKVEPDFLISFLNSSIETLEKSKETEINGIMPKEELLVRLKEKKISMERMYLDNTERDADSSFSFSHSMSERNSKQVSLSHVKDYGKHSPPPSNRLEGCKKSISSPSMGTMVPHLLQESASLESLPGQTQDLSQQNHLSQQSSQQIQTQTQSQTQNANQCQSQPSQPQSKVNDITQDSSITSEPSTTTTTTSEEVVTTYREPSLKETPSSTFSHSRENTNNNHSESGLHIEMNEKFENALQLISSDKGVVQEGKLADEKSESSDAGADCIQNNEKSIVIISMEDNLTIESGDHTPVMRQSSFKTNSSHSPKYKSLNRKVESSDVYQIVDAIRRHTNMSFEISCEALRVVLTSMEQLYSGDINPYLEAIAVHVTEKVETPKELLGMTHDAKRLQYIFSQLADCKNDSQQRSWMVYEDEDDIIQFIEELVEILNNADESISCYEMSCDQYQAMVNLIQYYQMETRWPIKRLLLKAFTAACHLDAIIVDILITSVLPLEIVEDIKVQFTTLERLKDLIKMLTIIFCLGQPMPVNHQDYLGLQFAEFLLETIENHNSENFIDMLITLILAFNLQFTDPQQNPIIEAMQSVPTVKSFTEKILLLLNREEDPVRILKHPSNAMNSVMKIFIDIFSIKETAGLFYTTDNKVLIDIVVRQLSDLCAGNPLRRCYLELCRRILRNTNYAEHQHRKQDFMKIFTRIFCEDTEQSASDQQLVRDIANEFSQIFKA